MYRVKASSEKGSGTMSVMKATAAEALDACREFEKDGVTDISITTMEGKTISVDELRRVTDNA
jgi:hypothetical protein